MILLTPYTPAFQAETARRIALFFGFHASLIQGAASIDEAALQEAQETLVQWTSPGHELFLIRQDNDVVVFLHLGYRGPIVAWIEDIFVDESRRGQGIATETIRLAEGIVRAKPGYTALCLDVVPRNESALRLYHKLGFDSLSLLTLRKELGENKRDRRENLLGLTFRY